MDQVGSYGSVNIFDKLASTMEMQQCQEY